MSWLEVFVAAGGGGAVVATLKAVSGTVTEVVRTRLHGPAQVEKTKAESQHVDADTAKFFNEMAKDWAAQFREANGELTQQLKEVKGVVESMTDVVERTIPVLEAVASVVPVLEALVDLDPSLPSVVTKLREANAPEVVVELRSVNRAARAL